MPPNVPHANPAFLTPAQLTLLARLVRERNAGPDGLARHVRRLMEERP